jgi:small subunit ribosomal protein S2
MSGNENDGLDASEGDLDDEPETQTTESPAEADEAEAETDEADESDESDAAETTEQDDTAETADESDAAETADQDDAAEDEADDGATLDEDVLSDEEADLLIPVEEYLGAGVHIGTQQNTDDMRRFIHRVRTDGLYVLDISMTDKRIRTAARFLANYDPEQMLVASSRQYGRFPAEKFAEAVGARARTGRFIPGTLTNPDYEGYIEPDVVVVTDPIGDAQAVKEAITVGIPVIAMCDSNNTVGNVDLVVPTNNKGRKALSVVYWLLANETLDNRGADNFYALEDFESEL